MQHAPFVQALSQHSKHRQHSSAQIQIQLLIAASPMHAALSLPCCAAAAVAAFCAQRVFALGQERGVRDLEVSFAAIEVGA